MMGQSLDEKREKNNARRRIYYAIHREELSVSKADYQRAHRANHLEEYRIRERAYYFKNKDKKRAQAKAYRLANKEKCRLATKKWDFIHREEKMARVRMRKFGLSQEAFDGLLDKQGGVCAICNKVNWNGKGPHVDHDHITGKVRGILCHSCNVSLGLIKDDPNVARAMANYIETR